MLQDRESRPRRPQVVGGAQGTPRRRALSLFVCTRSSPTFDYTLVQASRVLRHTGRASIAHVPPVHRNLDRISSMESAKAVRLKSALDKADTVKALEARGLKISEELLLDDDLATELQNHIYLTYFPELVEEPVGELARYYGRYYWLDLFAEKYKRKFGPDAGLDQEVFQLLEQAEYLGLHVDWNVIEQLHNDVLATVS